MVEKTNKSTKRMLSEGELVDIDPDEEEEEIKAGFYMKVLNRLDKIEAFLVDFGWE